MDRRTNQTRHQEQSAWEAIRHHLGPLVELFERDDVTELSVNSDGSVWVERHGYHGMQRLEHVLSSESRRAIILSVAGGADKVCDEDNPSVGAELPVLGYRFQGCIEPAVASPQFTIRLGRGLIKTLEAYIADGALSREQAGLLQAAMAKRKNILVAGGTGTGKTTFCNALLGVLGETCTHRIVLIEDVPELACPVPNKVELRVNRQTRFDYDEALRVTLRQSPDRIVVGELRDGAAALGLLKAWNTGHSGGVTTIHANHARAALPRLEQLIREVVKSMPRDLVAEAIDVIVAIEKVALPTGDTLRRVSDVALLHDALTPQGNYQLEHHWHPSVKLGARAR